MVIFPLPQNKPPKSPPRLGLKRLLKEFKNESYRKHKVWNVGIELTNSVSVNLLPMIIAWLVEDCWRFCVISWCCNILFYSNIAINANFSSYFDSQKTKERHGLKIRRLYLIKNITLELSCLRHVLASLVSPKTFSKSGLCIIFLLLRILLSRTLCVFISFPTKFPYKIRYYLFYKMKSRQNI